MRPIPYSRPFVDKKDVAGVIRILNSQFLTKGKETIKFENSIKKFCKVKYSLATINASCALILACKVLEVTEKDYIWTSAITYVASINCALHLKAKIDLVDIDADTNNISIIDLKRKLEIAKKEKKLPKILIVVHLAGRPCDLIGIKNLSIKYHFKIIEDASHAFGSKYFNKPIGNCMYSDFSIFSFHPVKNITTAEGGAITTNNKKYYLQLRSLRENGQTFKNIKVKEFPTLYDIDSLGYNFRINEINSALGNSQIKKINKFIKLKKKIVRNYVRGLSVPQITLPPNDQNQKSSWHLFIIKINFNLLKIKKYKFIKILSKKGVGVNVHYIPLYKFSLLKKIIKNKKNFKNSEDYFYNAISIPMYPQLSINKQNRIISIIKKTINTYKR